MTVRPDADIYTLRNADGDTMEHIAGTDDLCRHLRALSRDCEVGAVQIEDQGRVSELTWDEGKHWTVRTPTASPNFTLIASAMAARLNADPLGLLTPDDAYHAWLREAVDHRMAPAEPAWADADPAAISAMLLCRHAVHGSLDGRVLLDGWTPDGTHVTLETDNGDAALSVASDPPLHLAADRDQPDELLAMQAMLTTLIRAGIQPTLP